MGRTRRSPRPITCVLAVLLYASSASAIEPCELARLTQSDAPAGGGVFGHSVAIGDYIVVGSFGDSDQGLSAGAAYVYERVGTSWVEQAKVFAPDAAPRQFFGVSVATEGDRIVVGANALNFVGFFDPGAVYVFRPNEPSNCCTAHEAPGCDDEACAASVCAILFGCCTSGWDSLCVDTADLLCNPCSEPWVQEAKLSAPQALDGDRFGSSVSISGELLIVGAPLPTVGRVYVFRLQGGAWVLEAELVGSDFQPGDWFGRQVAIDGDTAVVGANGSDLVAENAGAAYVFRRDGTGWCEEAVLTASDAGPSDAFGIAVAVRGDTITVIAPVSGSYVFRRIDGTWVEETKLLDETRTGSVALEDDLVVIGPGAHGAGGTVHVLRRVGSDWLEESSFQASDVASADHFGISVDMAGGLAVIGSEAEAAYVFAVTDDCNTNGLADICDIAADASNDCDDDLVPDDCQPDCDENGVADSCDIANGTLEDDNADGIPDVCESVIPTLSIWGMTATALLLLICAKLYFERQRHAASYRAGESL